MAPRSRGASFATLRAKKQMRSAALRHAAAFEVKIPARGNGGLLQGAAHLSVIERPATADRNVGALFVALPAAGGRRLDRQRRWWNAPAALDRGLAKMNRVVGFRQSARHPIGDLAAAEPPLRTDGF